MGNTGIVKIIYTTIILALSASVSFAVLDDNICIVQDHNAKSIIVLAEQNATALMPDVHLLTQYIEKSTGAAIPVVIDSVDTDTNNIEIHIGNTAYVRNMKLTAANSDSDGFCIYFPASDKIVIVGNSESGLRYGIYEFIERYIGVRWLFPGELGEYIPEKNSINIPSQPVQQDPAFWSRSLSSPEISQIEQDNHIRQWAKRLRMHHRIEFHHNLNTLLPPSKYYKDHSCWYPPIKGEKIRPEDGTPVMNTWQPIFDAPGIMEESVKNIKQFFKDNPDVYSFSLGINDTENFGRSSQKLNSLGLPDLSDYYYGWATHVASQVLESYPDKVFGCLAYFNVADPPQNIIINPSILPFITFDRMGWFSKETAEKDMKRTIEWNKAAKQIGWYDYIYGDMYYKIPRIYWHLQADYLKFAHANGVRAVYAEAYPAQNWIEGPKLYLYLKLLWNPAIDVDKILDEWYELAVGTNAAPHLKEYYQFWEHFWSQRVTKSVWFKRGILVTWLPFQDDGYLSDLTKADMDKCRKLLDEVLKKAMSEQEKNRAAFFIKGFEEFESRLGNLLDTRGALVKLQDTLLKKYDFTPDEEFKKSSNNLPKDWVFWSQLPVYEKIWWDKESGYAAPGSLAMDANGLTWKNSCFTADIPVKPSQAYRIVCWFKTDQFSADGFIGLVVKWKNTDGQWIEQYQSVEQYAGILNSNKWEQLCVHFIVPPIQNPMISVQLVVQNADKGIVRFDDFSVRELLTN